MQETSRYAVGIDIGTTKVRCVIGYTDAATGTPTIVGVGEAANSGMRKGTIVTLGGPFKAIDMALNEAERMSGYHVTAAAVSINGDHILSTKADGMIAVGTPDHEITDDDLERLKEVATVGKIPPNRTIIDVVPFSYRLDSQSGIKDPLGMTGTRLEINANVVSSLKPHEDHIHRVMDDLDGLQAEAVEPSVMAAARAVLSEQQIENGVAVIDFGGATTSIAVYEEGDLQYVGVVPLGSNNITNDLAIGLKTDPAIAEEVKLQYGSATSESHTNSDKKTVTVKRDKESFTFSLEDIDEIIEARLEEIFEALNKELKKAGKKGQLPNGVVLVGAGARLKHLADYAKEALGLAAKIGLPNGFSGVAEQLDNPAYAAAVGLMFLNLEAVEGTGEGRSGASKQAGKKGAAGKNAIARFFERFKA